MKKNEETSRNMKNKREISEDFHSFLSSHEKSSTIFRAYRCCCNFFRRNPRRFPCFCFRNVCFPEDNQQPILGSHRFAEEKWQFLLDVKHKHTLAKVSPFNEAVFIE